MEKTLMNIMELRMALLQNQISKEVEVQIVAVEADLLVIE